MSETKMSGEKGPEDMAVSPEDALRMVERLSRIPAAYVLGRREDLDLLYDLTGELWEDPHVGIDSYREFCPVFSLAMVLDNRERQHLEKEDRFRFVYSQRVNNAILLWGQILHDHARGKYRYREVTDSLRMTLGQYLDAVTRLNLLERGDEGQAWAERYSRWTAAFLPGYDSDMPLSRALNDQIACHFTGWEIFRRADYTLWCLGCEAMRMAQNGEKTEAAGRFLEALSQYGIPVDPADVPEADSGGLSEGSGHDIPFLERAKQNMVQVVGDSEDVPAGALRTQIFLEDRDYSPEAWQTLAVLCPAPEFQPLLKKFLSPERLRKAVGLINAAETGLYMLWIEPFQYLPRKQKSGEERSPDWFLPADRGRISVKNDSFQPHRTFFSCKCS